MMRVILRHANQRWRDPRSTNARLLDPRSQNKMKRRRAGVVHTNWDSLVTKWSGCQRWWDSCTRWENFVSVAEELGKRALKRDENKVPQCWNRKDEQEEESKKDKERKDWQEESGEISGYGRLQPGCELAEWKVEDKQSKIQSRRAKDAESVGQNRHTING